ncbi:MAG: helix-turn-helix domain-containing protein, partial [Christensenellales bacterium]
MGFLTVSEIAKKWNISERSVRNYCQQGRVKGAELKGKTWIIPEDAEKPERAERKEFSNNPLLNRLKEEKDMKLKGG